MMKWLKRIAGAVVTVLAGVGALLLYQRFQTKKNDEVAKEVAELDKESEDAMRKAAVHRKQAGVHEENAKRHRKKALDKVEKLEEEGHAKMADSLSRYARAADRMQRPS